MRTFIIPLAGLILLAAGGCATAGPNHVYFTTGSSPAVHDLGPPPADLPGVVASGGPALGLAYDFNTDHLFVRLARVIRVIERPSGKILRELPLPAELLPDNSPVDEVVGTNAGPAAADNGAMPASADLAIRSSDRHLFAVHPDQRSVAELTVAGDFVRRVELPGLAGRIGGLAYDQRNRRLLVLTAASPARVGAVGPDGNVTYYVTFAVAVNPVSLGYDSDAQHYYVPLADGRTLGEFDDGGHLVARHPVEGAITALDAGPRSFVRVF